MSLYSDVEQSIRKAVIAALSEYPEAKVIFANLNGTEPSESYVAISILSTTQIGRHSTSTFTNAAEELSIQAFYEVLVQFSFLGSKSGEMSQSFNHRINNNPVTFEVLNKSKLGVMRKSPIRRAPQLRETKWIENHNIDVTFNYVANTQQKFDTVESLEVDLNSQP